MKIAVQGCAHGELDIIYDTIEYIEKQENINIDLLLCCGDFQATRNLEDLKSMAVPPKYLLLGSFYKYYSGEKTAPKLTIFIGGNHESSTYLQELPYGGWVAPNIYYLGYAGVVSIAGIKIGGISGIYKVADYTKGRFERAPFNEQTIRSCYHIRNLDVFRLKQLSFPIQIMMSHDWPQGITDHGNVEQLKKFKPFLREDIESNELGNKPIADLLEYLKPDYWFAAHLHESGQKLTKFLALDKCLPRRRFLQILDIPHDDTCELELSYDLEWLTVLHLTNHLISTKRGSSYLPGPGCDERWSFIPTAEEMEIVLNKMQNNLVIPKNFVHTAAPHGSNADNSPGIKLNPQTIELCGKLGIDDPVALLLKEGSSNISFSNLNVSNSESNSFMGLTNSAIDSSNQSIHSEISIHKNITRTPLKLPTPTVHVPENSDTDFLTSTPLSKVNENEIVEPKNVCSAVHEKPEADNSDVVSPKKFRRRNIALYGSTDDD
ncbi:hypothetical protein RUM43_001760 [Polyplax serrata]|uniref:Lariat debranching enzyme C-terminal domain-containing protein n=1 Tax=Polyplax serrata TaxID=468196 RepID=A0AAN8SED9_POLSC